MAPWPAMRSGSATCATRFAPKSFWQLISGHSSASLGRAALMPSGTGARRGPWAVASCPSERRCPWCAKAAQQLNPAVLPRHCPRRSFDNSKKRGALESGALENSGALESGALENSGARGKARSAGKGGAPGRAERREGRSAGEGAECGGRGGVRGTAECGGSAERWEQRSAGEGRITGNSGLPARADCWGTAGRRGRAERRGTAAWAGRGGGACLAEDRLGRLALHQVVDDAFLGRLGRRGRAADPDP